MNHPVRTRPDPDEVRARILEVAEQHCRRIGYHKTSVADIASEHNCGLTHCTIEVCGRPDVQAIFRPA